MIARNTSPMSQPPYCVRGPLRKALHCRPWLWISRLVSMPGNDAYWRVSLMLPHSGGLFHPGTAVEPCTGAGWICGVTGFCPSFSGFGVTGGAFAPRCESSWVRRSACAGAGCGLCAGACATAANGSASAAPRIRAPRRRTVCSIMSSPRASLLAITGAQVLVLVVRALGHGLFVLRLVALEAVAGVSLRVFLARVRLGRVLRNLVAGG